MKDYVEVKERVQQFYALYPDGRIASDPPRVVEIGDRLFVEVTTRAYRSPDDPCPCVGSAWEPFPGRTTFTKDSEMMNAETSAIGRALAAAGVAVSRSMASANEVRNRQAERNATPTGRKESPAIAKQRADVLRFLNAVPMPERTTAKREFVETFGDRPADLDPAMLSDALAWAKEWTVVTAPETALDQPETAAGPEQGGTEPRNDVGGSSGSLVEIARSAGVTPAKLLRAARDLADARGVTAPESVETIPAELVDDLTAWAVAR